MHRCGRRKLEPADVLVCEHPDLPYPINRINRHEPFRALLFDILIWVELHELDFGEFLPQPAYQPERKAVLGNERVAEDKDAHATTPLS